MGWRYRPMECASISKRALSTSLCSCHINEWGQLPAGDQQTNPTTARPDAEHGNETNNGRSHRRHMMRTTRCEPRFARLSAAHSVWHDSQTGLRGPFLLIRLVHFHAAIWHNLSPPLTPQPLRTSRAGATCRAAAARYQGLHRRRPRLRRSETLQDAHRRAAF